MAKQKGARKLAGTIAELTYYKSKNGYIVRETSPLSAQRLATDPAFAKTRENMSEFGRASKAGKYIRTAFRSLVQNAKDSNLVGRLTKEVMQVIKTDNTSARGLRNLVNVDASLLQGFDFTSDAKLGATPFAPYSATIDRATGNAALVIPSFLPINQVVASAGATHFKLVSTLAEIDFGTGNTATIGQESAPLKWNGSATAALNLEFSLPVNSVHPLFLVLGIQFYQQVNGVQYSLKSGAFNELSIVKVS